MKVKRYPYRKNCWQIIVPAGLNGGKRQRKYFKTKELAEEEKDRLEHRGPPIAGKMEFDGDEAATIQLARSELGGDLKLLLEAARHYRLTVLSVSKRAHLLELIDTFEKRQIHEGRAPRTLDDDRQRLRKLCEKLGNIDVRLMTEPMIRQYLEQYPPGGNRKSHYKTVHKFVAWAHKSGYLGLDLMEKLEPLDKHWGVNNEIIEIGDFRRLLFVTSGLEPIKPDEKPTTKYLGLLPYFVLGGLAGMRRGEMLRDRASQQIVEWTDIQWSKNLIKVRQEVAKHTRAADRRRDIPLEPAAREWLHMVSKKSGPVVNIYQSTHTKLIAELLEKLEITLPENGLRNSYATYGQSFRSSGDVARACGDLESTIKRFYTDRSIEPDEGRPWFEIRPGMQNKIVQMTA
jgi:hypothetical protein